MIFNKKLFLSVVVLLSNSLILYSQGDEVKEPLKIENGSIIIEDFENDSIGQLPSRWYNRDLKRKANHPEEEKKFRYVIQEEDGNKFLHYAHTDARHLNLPLAKREGLNIHETPILSWKWRVKDIPEGANEDHKDKNDVAASVYVVYNFGRVLFKRVPKSIRYTWSSTLPVGTELSKFYGNQKIIVVASGEDGLDEWKTFQRNIVEDYERLFGDEAPEKPLALLILSDGDDTHDHIIADYDDFLLLPNKE